MIRMAVFTGSCNDDNARDVWSVFVALRHHGCGEMDTDTTLAVWSLMLGGVGEKTDEARDDNIEYNDDGVSEVVGEVISTTPKVLGDEKVEKRTEWQWIPTTVTDFVSLHDIPYIFLSPNSQPYLSIEDFLTSPDQYRDLSTFVPNALFP